MASIGKNGQPSMEEILASIRRIVADDVKGPIPLIDLNKPHSTLQAGSVPGQGRVDDSPDFELPSMFRPGHGSDDGLAKGALKRSVKSGSMGRLTDAIRNVTPKSINGDNSTGNQFSAGEFKPAPGKPEAPSTPYPVRGDVRPNTTEFKSKDHQSLSSLNRPIGSINGAGSSVSTPNNGAQLQGGTATNTAAGTVNANSSYVAEPVHSDAQQAHQPMVPQSPAVEAIVPSPDASQSASQPVSQPVSMPRVMAPFRDTKMARMGAMTRMATPTAAPAAGPHDNAVAAPQSQMDDASRGAAMQRASGFMPAAAPPPAVAAPAESPAVQSEPEGLSMDASPPPLPGGPDTDGGVANIEDATADLLRPMLRQWLSENMPRMVEKALHIEVAQSLQPKKPDDQ